MPGNYWEGMPSAQEVARLDKIHPGLGERAFKVIEREQRHQHFCRLLGLWSSLGFAVVSLVTSILLIVNGHVAGGIGTAGAWGLGSAGVFATSRIPSGKERGEVTTGSSPSTSQ
jgi:uncharacterized membrane protein